MNCGDEFGDCRQGRDCPARKCSHCYGIGYDASGYACTCTSPAKVARVGRKDHAREPLPASHSRIYLRSLAKALLFTLAVMLVSALTVALIPKSVRYDCSIASIHPDIPPAAKAKCRKKVDAHADSSTNSQFLKPTYWKHS